MYVVLLGLDVLGNPFGLAVGVARSVEDLFYEPFQVHSEVINASPLSSEKKSVVSPSHLFRCISPSKPFGAQVNSISTYIVYSISTYIY